VTHLVSCIVPVFNGERYLAEALDSILAQTWRPLEVIVVDDGSTDGTASVAARYGDRITCIRQPNAGPAAARNRGIDTANGPFLAFLDADDLWHGNKLARQMARFEARPELEISLTLVRNFWTPEVREEEERLRGHRFAQPIRAYSPPAMLARRAVFGRVGRFDTALRMGEDNDWFLRAAEAGIVIEFMDEVLTFRRMHDSNLGRDYAGTFDALPDIVKASLDRRRKRAGRGPAPARAERRKGK